MANIIEDVLIGTHATVFLEGEELGAWQSIELNEVHNYEDIIVGETVDRVEVSKQYEGSLSTQITNSIGVELSNKLRNNRAKRFVIECTLQDKKTGALQATTINGVTFDSIPLVAWTKGEVINNELSFRANNVVNSSII